MVGAQFSRVRPSKNQSRDRLRTTTARGNVQNRFRRRLRRHFFGPGRVFDRFWGSGRVPKITKNQYFDSGARPPERNFLQVLLKMLAGSPPSAKSYQKFSKIDRKLTKNRSKIDRTIRHGMLAKCRSTLPKIKHKLREDTLGNPIRRAIHLRVRRSLASVFNNTSLIRCYK